MHSLCVVVPVFQLKRDQYQNFWYVLQQILHANLRVLVVEQLRPGRSRALKRKIEQMFDTRVKHMSVHIDDDKIHKSRLINRAVESISTTHVWVNDADCVMNFEYVLSRLDLSKQFIKPYIKSVDLSPKETTRLLNTKQVVLESPGSIKSRDINMYGALSFIFNRSAFTRVGMMNETFTGWGLEDAEFEHRVTQAGHKPHVIDNVAYHLWHEQHKQNFDNWFNPAAKPLNVVKTSTKSNRVIHVVGLINPIDISCVDDNYRMWISLQSIMEADRTDVLLVGATTSDDTHVESWKMEKLSRVFSDEQSLPYVRDMFNLALKHATHGDRILYTNADCMISPDIYNDILASDAQAIMYHRRETKPHDTVQSCFEHVERVEKHGVDGFMMTHQLLKHMVDDIPDMVVGEPCWDMVMCNMLEKYKTKKDTSRLCHIQHKKRWSLKHPSDATHHNVKLARPYLSDQMFTDYDTRLTYTDELCVMSLCCEKEVLTGKFEPMMYRFFGYECSVDKQFDVFLCFDTISETTQKELNRQVLAVKRVCTNINEIYIYNSDIPDNQNMFGYDAREFAQRRQQDPSSLRLGTTSGINIQFFDALRYILKTNNKHKRLLLIEADSEPIVTNWFDPLYQMCTTRQAAVLGSRYCGVDDTHRERWYKDHLNGIGVYKGCPELFELLQRSEKIIESYVNDQNNVEKWLNFDVAMLLAATELNMLDQLVDVEFISNYSDTISAKLSVDNVLNRHPKTVILHKKESAP